MAANMEITDVLIYQLSIMTDPLLSLEQISEIWRWKGGIIQMAKYSLHIMHKVI